MAKRKAKKLVRELLKRYIAELDKKGIHIDEAYLFGSYAQDTAKQWSDIDVALLTKKFIGDSFDFKFLLMKIAREIDLDIEPHPYLVEEFRKDNPIAAEVMKTGIKIL